MICLPVVVLNQFSSNLKRQGVAKWQNPGVQDCAEPQKNFPESYPGQAVHPISINNGHKVRLKRRNTIWKFPNSTSGRAVYPKFSSPVFQFSCGEKVHLDSHEKNHEARQPSAALERVTFATLSALGIEEQLGSN